MSDSSQTPPLASLRLWPTATLATAILVSLWAFLDVRLVAAPCLLFGERVTRQLSNGEPEAILILLTLFIVLVACSKPRPATILGALGILTSIVFLYVFLLLRILPGEFFLATFTYFVHMAPVLFFLSILAWIEVIVRRLIPHYFTTFLLSLLSIVYWCVILNSGP